MELYQHLCKRGTNPLDMVFPWLMSGFAAHVAPAETLLLWDRIIGYDSLLPLPVLAVAILTFRWVCDGRTCGSHENSGALPRAPWADHPHHNSSTPHMPRHGTASACSSPAVNNAKSNVAQHQTASALPDEAALKNNCALTPCLQAGLGAGGRDQ